MPYAPEHRKRTRARIVRSAQILFNREGFERVSIDDIMSLARLTRGGFYRHFRSKSDLYAEAVALSLSVTPWSRWDGVSVDFSAEDAAKQVVHAYLSRQHFEDVDNSCPTVALPNDISRSNPKVKRAFEGVFKAMVGVFETGLRRAGRPDRNRALAIAGLCVGGMVVARAVDDPALADGLRKAASAVALELGGWSKTRRRSFRR